MSTISANDQETILHVDGMSCASCVRHVEGALRAIDGVASIEVQLREGRVRVEHDPARATIAQMIDAIGEAGYDARVSAP